MSPHYVPHDAALNLLYGPAMFRLAATGGAAASIGAPYTRWMGALERLIAALEKPGGHLSVYAGKWGRSLAQYVYGRLQEGFAHGAQEAPPAPTLENAIRQNIALFAEAKTMVQLKRAHEMLLDGKGEVRSQAAYIKEARQRLMMANTTSTLQHLRTEYATALAQGNSLRRWQQAEANADIFPCLEFRTVQDERVRHSHQQLHGIRRAIGDAFWEGHTPPLDWNCRCRVVPVEGPKGNNTDFITPTVTVGRGFGRSVAKTGEVLAADHYLGQLGGGEQAAVRTQAKRTGRT